MSYEVLRSPLRIALLAQLLGGGIIAVLIALFWPGWTQFPFIAALILGGGAALVSYALRAPYWWLPIHLFFVPAVVVARGAEIASGWWLAGFGALLLLFWRTDKSRVPLYLTNDTAAQAVAALLPNHPCRVLDLGCGEGGLLSRLAQLRPDCKFLGVEHAPLPWLLARIRAVKLVNATIRHGDFWELPLREHDFVYAFLSPAPMPRLWDKATREMQAGAILVSNSFAVPNVAPKRVVAVDDRRKTQLFLYLPGGTK